VGDGIGDLAFWLAVGLIGLGVTTGPLGRAIGRAVTVSVELVMGRLFGGGTAGTDAEVARLAQRLEELQGVEHRVLELEERLDFTERMLARGLPAPGRPADTPPEPVAAAR